jgi:hypothetical protein
MPLVNAPETELPRYLKSLISRPHKVTRWGLGRHIWAIKPSPENFRNLFKGLFVLQVTYIIEIVLIKCSILAFYWRIFNVSSIRYPIYSLFTIVILWEVATVRTIKLVRYSTLTHYIVTKFLVICLQCIPINGLWDKSIQAACKIDNKKFYLGNIIPNIMVDVLLLILPAPYVWRLN